jgi:NitT/TauT family transport system permease protein
MSRVRLIQLGIVGAVIAILELLCRAGIIDRFTIIPPSEMLLALATVIATAPWFWSDVSYTLGNLAAAIALSVLGGFLIGASHRYSAAAPRARSDLHRTMRSRPSCSTRC